MTILTENFDTTTVEGCRAAEAHAFRRAAELMEKAVASGNADMVEQALRFNQLLWSLIVADMTEKDNRLPTDLKANILSLSIFVENQTAKMLQSPGAATVASLVGINRNLADGLSGSAA